MSNIPFFYTVKTIGLSVAEYINTIYRIHEELDNLKDAIIAGTKVELSLELKFNDSDRILTGKEMVEWVRNEHEPLDPEAILRIKSNRFVFLWFAQGVTDIGAIIEKYEPVKTEHGKEIYGVFEAFVPRAYKHTFATRRPLLDRILDQVKPVAKMANENKGTLLSAALAVGGMLIAKRIGDDIVERTEQTVRDTMREYEPPTIEIHVDEYGTFEDAQVER